MFESVITFKWTNPPVGGMVSLLTEESMAPINRANELALTQARLRELLSYDPETGEFTWRIATSSRTPAGSRAGCYADRPKSGKRHYVLLGIDGTLYLGHRVAWFYMTGRWPDGDVDHKDGDGWNNRFSNLRKAEHQQNMFNQKRRSDNRSGVKGVYLYNDGRKSPYQVWLNSKYLASFATLEEAAAYREEAASRSHGAFYRDA